MFTARVGWVGLVAGLVLGSTGPGCSSSGHDAPQASSPDAGAPSTDAASADGGATATVAIDPFSSITGSVSEHEPSVAVSPGGHVAVSFLSGNSATGTFTIGYRISNDGGATWGPATLFPLIEGDNIQANSSVAAGDDDTLYVAWGAESKNAAGVRTGIHVYAAKAAPGATSFETPIEVTDPSIMSQVLVYDMPRVSVTHAGVVNITYTQVSSDEITTWIMDARSTDFQTWTRAIVAGPGSYYSFRNQSRVCRPSGATGRIYVSYADSDMAEYYDDTGVGLRSSDDDGKTWSAPVAVQTLQDEALLQDYPIDCKTNGDDVWVMYSLIAPGELLMGGSVSGSPETVPTLAHLRVAHSSDRGQTMDAHADFQDEGAGSLFMYPVFGVEETGALDVAYYAGREDNDPKATLRRSRSTDGGAFAPSVAVHSPLTLETSRTGSKWVGDYTGAACSAGNLFLVYTDNAAGASHIAFVRTAVAMPADAPTSDAGAGSGDSGIAEIPDAEIGCYAGKAFTPWPWAPPTPFAQGACTSAQITAYLACSATATGDCSAFRTAANAACVACLETDVAAPAHGPFVTQTTNGTVQVVETNAGGCQAHYDGDVSKGGCGNQANDLNDCFNAECSACSDFASPSQTGPTESCEEVSYYLGVCNQNRETTSCMNETVEGGASTCSTVSTFVTAWCGP